jgi:thymidylate synthase (FAD)
MKVTLIASTQMHEIPSDLFDTKFGIRFNDRDQFWHAEDAPNDADTLAHFSGRACYQSWNMPNPETQTDDDYIANIIKQGHFSVLEHASATFYIEGVSRNMTHELVRHRHLSYSELSQRYVDMSTAESVIPPAIRELHEASGTTDDLKDVLPYTIDDAFGYAELVAALTTAGYTRKQAREAARFYLPSGMETKIVVTGNMRAWRDMLHKRYSVHADAEIREFATEILKQLREIAPASFQDFPEEPFQ